MIDQACPVIVLDDEKPELWQIVHGLGVCGLPVMSHWIDNGKLERKPHAPYQGVRVLFTDLHILGPTQTDPEKYISALVGFIQQLIAPSTYLIVFWSGFSEDAGAAWDFLESRLKTAKANGLIPFAYRVLDKTDVKQISDEDPSVAAQATANVQKSIAKIFDDFPQLRSFMNWESCASRAASATSNELIDKLKKGGISFTSAEAVKATLKRMSQEALGMPHAPSSPTKGVYQALMPIAQDFLNREAESGALDGYLELTKAELIPLPEQPQGAPALKSLLNDFFIHTEQGILKSSDRGVVIRLLDEYLNDKDRGLVSEIGLARSVGDWRDAVCMEFARNYIREAEGSQNAIKGKLDPKNVLVVELSADCDYAQDKTRSHRFLLALFVPSSDSSPFYSSSKGGAHDAIYVTQEITLEGVQGRFLISCRIFLTRPYKASVAGAVITRLRQEVLSEIAHHYSTHMRRPGKIAFH